MAFLQCSHLSLRRRRWKRDGLIGKRERMYWVFLQCVFSEEKKEVEDRKLGKRGCIGFSPVSVCSQPVSFPAPSSHLIGSSEREGCIGSVQRCRRGSQIRERAGWTRSSGQEVEESYISRAEQTTPGKQKESRLEVKI